MNYLATLQDLDPTIYSFFPDRNGFINQERVKDVFNPFIVKRLKDISNSLSSGDVTTISIVANKALLLDVLRSQVLADIFEVRLYCPELLSPEPCIVSGNEIILFELFPVNFIQSHESPDAIIWLSIEQPVLPNSPTKLFHIIPPPSEAPEAKHYIELSRKKIRDYWFQKIGEVFVPQKTICFASGIEYFHFQRVSTALRRHGYKTIFIGLTSRDSKFKSDSFDLTCSVGGDLELFFSLLNAYSYNIVHFQGWMGHHHLAAAATLLTENKIIVELNDLPCFFLKPEFFDDTFGAGSMKKEMTSLAKVVNEANGLLLNRSNEYTQKLFDLLSVNRTISFSPFHTYPLEDYFAGTCNDPDDFSIVFPGTLLPSNFPEAAFADGQILSLIRDFIVPQKITYHIYLNPFLASDPNRYWDYYYLEKKTSFFKIHQGLPPKELATEISRFGYGGLFYFFNDHFRVLMDHYRSIIPSKVFTLIEAGLPIIYNEEFEYLGSLVEKYNIGFSVSQEDITCKKLRRKMEDVDYCQLRKNVTCFRKKISMNTMINNLVEFYTKVPDKSKSITSYGK